MKKIVALVLALVLALSLATVAFAATTFKVGSQEVVEKTGSGYVTRYVGKDDGKVYVAAKAGTLTDLKINDVDSGIDVAEAVESNNYGKYSIVAEEYEAPKAADMVCGDVKGDKDLYVADGVYYEDAAYDANDSDIVWLNVDDVIVCAKAYTLTKNDVKNHVIVPVRGADGKITGFTCSKCDAELAFTKVKADALKAGVIFDEYKTGVAPNVTTYYVMYAANTAAAGTTSTKVESVATFDAGVALYAGMALMSVAGSAVVIGKKKEF